jgi:hypothetical protein
MNFNKDDIYYKKLYFKYKTKYLKLKQIGGVVQCVKGTEIKNFTDLKNGEKYRYLGIKFDRENTIVQYNRGYNGENSFTFDSGDKPFNGHGFLNRVDLLCNIPKSTKNNSCIKISSLTIEDIGKKYKYLGRDYNRTNTIVQLESINNNNNSGKFKVISTGNDSLINTNFIEITDPSDRTKFILCKEKTKLIVECKSNKNSFTNTTGSCSLYASFMLIILTNAVAQHTLQKPEIILNSFMNAQLFQYLPWYLFENSNKLKLTPESRDIISDIFISLQKRLDRLINPSSYTDLVCENDLIMKINKLIKLNPNKKTVFNTPVSSFLILSILSIFLCNDIYKYEDFNELFYKFIDIYTNPDVNNFLDIITKCNGITISIKKENSSGHNMVFYRCENVLKFCDNSIILNFDWISFFKKILELKINKVEYDIYYNFEKLYTFGTIPNKYFRIIYKKDKKYFTMIVFDGTTIREIFITIEEYNRIKANEYTVHTFYLITLFNGKMYNALEHFKLIHRSLLYDSKWFNYYKIEQMYYKETNNGIVTEYLDINTIRFYKGDCIKYYSKDYGYRYGKITNINFDTKKKYIRHYNPKTLVWDTQSEIPILYDNYLHLVQKIDCPKNK